MLSSLGHIVGRGRNRLNMGSVSASWFSVSLPFSEYKGYIMGGFTSANVAVIEDLVFSNETSAAIAATLDTAKREGTGVNSSTKGYIMGGYTTAALNTIEDLVFSNETSAAIAATLDAAKRLGVGVQSGAL